MVSQALHQKPCFSPLRITVNVCGVPFRKRSLPDLAGRPAEQDGIDLMEAGRVRLDGGVVDSALPVGRAQESVLAMRRVAQRKTYRGPITRGPQLHCFSHAPRTMFGYSDWPRLPL